MSKIPKPLIEAVEDALKTGRKASGATDMASVRQSLPEQIVPKKRAIGVPKKPDPVIEERMPAPPQVKPLNAKEAIYSFMDQYRTNPFNPREIIVGNALVELQRSGDKAMHLSSIRTLQPNSGESSKALKAVTDMADANGIDISLFAVPYGDSGLKKKQLIEWYKRNGFIKVRGDEMVRKAKK